MRGRARHFSNSRTTQEPGPEPTPSPLALKGGYPHHHNLPRRHFSGERSVYFTPLITRSFSLCFTGGSLYHTLGFPLSLILAVIKPWECAFGKNKYSSFFCFCLFFSFSLSFFFCLSPIIFFFSILCVHGFDL